MPLGHTSILLGRIIFSINRPILEVHLHYSLTWNLHLGKSVYKALYNYLQYKMCIVYTLQVGLEIMPSINYLLATRENQHEIMYFNEFIKCQDSIYIFYLLERKR